MRVVTKGHGSIGAFERERWGAELESRRSTAMNERSGQIEHHSARGDTYSKCTPIAAFFNHVANSLDHVKDSET